jgi:hypothetical protein
VRNGNEKWALKLIVDAEAFVRIDAKDGFLMKALRWSWVLHSSEVITFNDFAVKENMASWDAELLSLTKEAGQTIRKSAKIETMMNMYEAGDTLDQSCSSVRSHGVAFDRLTAAFGVKFEVKYSRQEG